MTVRIVFDAGSAVQSLTADQVIELLDLAPHPEGGYFRETFRDVPDAHVAGNVAQRDFRRAASTAIFFLLVRGERSHWHRIDAAEVWHWYAGAPLALEIAQGSGPVERLTLGCDLISGQRPQAVVPVHAWQTAQTLGDWTLTGCTVAPGFEFSGFELAPRGWKPQR